VPADDPVLHRIREWAARQDAVRVVILTSSRARDDGGTDRFADYDVMLFLSESSTLASDSAWLDAFGRVLVSFRDEVGDDDAR
jgi:aminoglycoside 6-adenylyltransferase